MQKEKRKSTVFPNNRLNIIGRNKKPRKKRPFARRRQIKSNAGFSTCHFLDVIFTPCHIWDIYPDSSSFLKVHQLFTKHLSGLFVGVTAKTEALRLSASSTVLEEIAESTQTGWFLTEVDQEMVAVFHLEYSTNHDWYAPRLGFLPKLKQRSKNMHDTVLNSFRIITKSFALTDFTDAMYVLDWAMERGEDEYDDSFRDEKERLKYKKMVQSYLDGKPREYLNTVFSESEMEIDLCIKKLFKFPEDLSPLTHPVIQLLELSKSGKSGIHYDLRYGYNFSDIPFDGPSIDVMFNWIWDFDEMSDIAEDFMQNESQGEGIIPPHGVKILGSQFYKPSSVEELIKEIELLKEDDFIKEYSSLLENLCHGINKCFPSKFAQ